VLGVISAGAGPTAAADPTFGGPVRARNTGARPRRCAEPDLHGGQPPWVATVGLGKGTALLEVLLARATGRVTVCVVEKPGGEPVRLHPDVMALYVDSVAGGPPTRVWLDPVETETDDWGVIWATRFSGASNVLRGAAGFEGMISLVLVRGTPFWGVGIHVEPGSSYSRGK
jgi:hypothetical protein